jgi:hypothetical protein
MANMIGLAHRHAVIAKLKEPGLATMYIFFTIQEKQAMPVGQISSCIYNSQIFRE